MSTIEITTKVLDDYEKMMDEDTIRKSVYKKRNKRSLFNPRDFIYISLSLLQNKWAFWNADFALHKQEEAKDQAILTYELVGILSALILSIIGSFFFMMDPNEESIITQGGTIAPEHKVIYVWVITAGVVACMCSIILCVYYSLLLAEMSTDGCAQWFTSMGRLHTAPVTTLVLGTIITGIQTLIFIYDCMGINRFLISILFFGCIGTGFFIFPALRGGLELYEVAKTNQLTTSDKISDTNENANTLNDTTQEIKNKMLIYEKFLDTKNGFMRASKEEFLQWLTYDTWTNKDVPVKVKLSPGMVLRANLEYNNRMHKFTQEDKLFDDDLNKGTFSENWYDSEDEITVHYDFDPNKERKKMKNYEDK